MSRDGCPMLRSSIIRKASEGYRGHQVGVCLWRDHDWRRVVEAHLVDGFKKQSMLAEMNPDMVRSGVDLLWNVLEYVC